MIWATALIISVIVLLILLGKQHYNYLVLKWHRKAECLKVDAYNATEEGLQKPRSQPARANWYERYRDGDSERRKIGIVFAVIAGCLLVTCFIGTAVNYTADVNLQGKQVLVPQKIAQKEALIKVVEDELSPKQLAELYDAVSEDSLKIIFGNPAVAASDVLIERAKQIISLNAQINDLRNEILIQQIEVCKTLKNMFVPKLPFGNPDCAIDFGVTGS